MMTQAETDKLNYWIDRAIKAEVALNYICALPDEGRGYGDLAVVTARNTLAGLNHEAVPDVVAALREAVNWAEGYAKVGTRNPPAFLDAARAALSKLEDVE